MSVFSRKESIVIYSEHQRDSLVEKCVAEHIPYSIRETEDEFTKKSSYVMKVRERDMRRLIQPA